MIIVFYILAVVLVVLSFRSLRGGIDFLRYVRTEVTKAPSSFTPFVSVIAPCRGVDEGMDKNLSLLLDQDYPDYEVIFVVDDGKDPAVKVIDKISCESPKHARLVIAPKAVESGQKVENLREAVLHASDESRVFVLADSDARPAKDWLASLVAPLEDDSVGASTGYRWFISERPSFASELRSAWNASIASALGPNRNSNFCWGGSMAIRRDIFERLDIRGKWLGTLSDDFTATRAIKAAGLSIHFVPGALTASIENCSFRELLEFTTRQMKITRVYAPALWKISLIGSALFNVTLIGAVLITIFSSADHLSFWIAIAVIVLVSMFSIGKSWLRLKAVRMILTDRSTELRRQFWPQSTFWLLTQAVFLYNAVAAGLSRRMVWRSVRYELVSATETRVLE